MNRRQFLQNGAMAAAAVSMAPAAVLAEPRGLCMMDLPMRGNLMYPGFAVGGIIKNDKTYIVGDRVSERCISPEQMERIKKLIYEPDYYSRPLQTYCYWKTEVKP